MEPLVIYEDKNFLAVDKPSGWLTHGVKLAARKSRSASRNFPVLTDWLIARYPEIVGVGDDPAERPGIVHRLDRETSGILLVARTQEAFSKLKKMFQNREIHKKYIALVSGRPGNDHGIIDKPIGLKTGSVKRSTRATRLRKDAITEYRLVKSFGLEEDSSRKNIFSLLEIYPKTGRTHQIRVHLASIGCPVVGDSVYGPKYQPVWATRLMLHAESLKFSYGADERFELSSDFPEDITAAVKRIN